MLTEKVKQFEIEVEIHEYLITHEGLYLTNKKKGRYL